MHREEGIELAPTKAFPQGRYARCPVLQELAQVLLWQSKEKCEHMDAVLHTIWEEEQAREVDLSDLGMNVCNGVMDAVIGPGEPHFQRGGMAAPVVATG